MDIRFPVMLLAFVLSAANAAAQSTRFELDATGAWVAVSEPAPGTDEAVIAQARRHLADGRPRDAWRVATRWVQANDLYQHPLMPEALLIRGDALVSMKREFKALYDYERLINQFPQSDSYLVANQREYEIAQRYLHGLKRHFIGIRYMDATNEGEELMIRIQERLPGSNLAEKAGIELADYYYNSRQLELAAVAYELFLRNYPDSPHRVAAMKRWVYSMIAQFKGPRYDTAVLLDARELINRFTALYPQESAEAGLDDALVARIDESAALELLDTASWYIKRNDGASARFTLKRLIKLHPQTGAAAEAQQIMSTQGWTAPPTDIEAPAAAINPGSDEEPTEQTQAAQERGP